MSSMDQIKYQNYVKLIKIRDNNVHLSTYPLSAHVLQVNESIDQVVTQLLVTHAG